MEENLSVAQAAALYGCTHSNMSYLIKTGRMPHTKIGKRWILVKRSDLLALIEARDNRKYHNAWIEPTARCA